MIKLLHVTTVAQSLRFLRGQPQFFAQRGIEMEAITSPGPLVDTMADDLDIPVHTVTMPRQITPIRDLGALTHLIAKIRAIKPDIVHGHTPKGGLLAMLAATAAGVDARVYHMRGLPMETATGLKRTLLQTTETISCALAHQVIAVGHSLRDLAIEDGLCPAAKIDVMGHGSGQGVDADHTFNPHRFDDAHRQQIRHRFGIPHDAVVIGFVGRLVADKGIIELARAFEALRKDHPNAHLLVVGPFEKRDPVPPSTRALLEDDPRVHLTGFQSDVHRIYPAMDLVALPTHREGFPNVPLEAAAMELPTVVSDISACLETIDASRTGLTFPVQDADALADRITTYLDDPELRRQHGQAGRARVQKLFAPHRIWHDLHDVYRQLTPHST